MEALLTSEEQYRSMTRNLPRLSREEETEIIKRATAGDLSARERLLTSCLNYIGFIANRYRQYLYHDEYLDLVGIGNLAVVEHLDQALASENPCGYLRSVAKYSMIHYCYTRAHLIVRPDHGDPVLTTSLDTPFYANTLAAKAPEEARECLDYSWLYEAVEQLPQRYQDVLIKHYGLYDRPPESLYELSRRMKANVKGSVAYLTEYRALRRLRKHLTKVGTDQHNALAR